jgi:hypothetical protein
METDGALCNKSQFEPKITTQAHLSLANKARHNLNSVSSELPQRYGIRVANHCITHV